MLPCRCSHPQVGCLGSHRVLLVNLGTQNYMGISDETLGNKRCKHRGVQAWGQHTQWIRCAHGRGKGGAREEQADGAAGKSASTA